MVLAAVVEAQSHNDKHYKTLGIPKDASPRQIKKVQTWKNDYSTSTSFFRPFCDSLE
jgi:hypothetical protein